MFAATPPTVVVGAAAAGGVELLLARRDERKNGSADAPGREAAVCLIEAAIAEADGR